MRPDKILGTTISSIQRYQNWVEIMMSIAKKQCPTKAYLRNGTRFEANVGFLWLVNEIFFHHVYTPRHLEIEKNDVVIDIGAHIGVFTVFAASKTKNTVYAFEPSPGNLKLIKRNVSLNSLDNVISQGMAVSDKIGSAALLLSPKATTRNMLSNQMALDNLKRYQTEEEHEQFEATMPGEFEECIEVPTTTLQNIMDNNHIDQVGFLKLDCEGAEGLILTSTPLSYLKRVRKIAIEFHDHLSTIDHNEIRKLLEAGGFITELRWNGKSPLGFLYAWRKYLSPMT